MIRWAAPALALVLTACQDDGQAARIAALEARVAALERGQAAAGPSLPPTAVSPDVVTVAAARHCAALFGQRAEEVRRETGRYPGRALFLPECTGLELDYQTSGDRYRLRVGAGGRELGRAGE